jgi:hypothetical protein
LAQSTARLLSTKQIALLAEGVVFFADKRSLRRHYPDQVLRVKDSRSFSQPGNTGLPVIFTEISIVAWGTLVKKEFPL